MVRRGPARFLFLTWDGGGVTVPVRAIARELLERGHEVRVLGHRAQAHQFDEDNIPFAAYRRFGDFRVTGSPLGLLRLMTSRDAAKDVSEELDAWPADLVVGDAILLSTLKALRSRNQRYALLESTTDTLMRGRLRKLAALAHGVPVLVIPLDSSSDQPGIGRAVERAGAGISLSRSASVPRLRSGIERLMNDRDLHQEARHLGKQIRGYGGPSAGADALIQAAADKG